MYYSEGQLRLNPNEGRCFILICLCTSGMQVLVGLLPAVCSVDFRCSRLLWLFCSLKLLKFSLIFSPTLMMCCVVKCYSIRMCILECLTYFQHVYLQQINGRKKKKTEQHVHRSVVNAPQCCRVTFRVCANVSCKDWDYCSDIILQTLYHNFICDQEQTRSVRSDHLPSPRRLHMVLFIVAEYWLRLLNWLFKSC